MTKWNNVQKRASDLINEGLKLVKEGAHEAEILAETTAEAAKLHVTAGQNKLERYRALHDLGLAVYKRYAASKDVGSVGVTRDIELLLKKIAGLDEATKNAEKVLAKFTVVKKSTAKKKSAKHKGRASK